MIGVFMIFIRVVYGWMIYMSVPVSCFPISSAISIMVYDAKQKIAGEKIRYTLF